MMCTFILLLCGVSLMRVPDNTIIFHKMLTQNKNRPLNILLLGQIFVSVSEILFESEKKKKKKEEEVEEEEEEEEKKHNTLANLLTSPPPPPAAP